MSKDIIRELTFTDGSKVSMGKTSAEQMRTTSLLRIAEATEVMSQNYVKLTSDHDWLKTVAKRRLDRIDELERRLSAQKGATTRAKNKADESIAKAAQWKALSSKVREMYSGDEEPTYDDLGQILASAFGYA